VDNTENIISFCTGYGGIELGLERAGANVRTRAYVEIEAFAVANLVAKIEQGYMDAAPIWTNLKTFPSRKFRGKIHGLIGGYPCQPFSCAGNRLGAEDPRHLWPYIKDHIRAIEPVWCFFENVEGHLSLGFREVKRDLEELGYRVEAGIFSAVEVGAVHRRKRLFILAYSSGSGYRGRGKSENRDDSYGVFVEKTKQTGFNVRGKVAMCDGMARNRTVSRPGQKQFEWEEPRTLESGLGSTVDGTSSRLDELRLLGNGVYPDTAAKAWRVLNRVYSVSKKDLTEFVTKKS